MRGGRGVRGRGLGRGGREVVGLIKRCLLGVKEGSSKEGLLLFC